jgi:hypothetical protein
MNSKTENLRQAILTAQILVPATSTWQHYKGGIYRVYGHVILTDDGRPGIAYHRIGGPNFDEIAENGLSYVRPLSEWFNDVKVRELGDEEFEHSTVKRFVEVKQEKVWVPAK